MHQPAEPISPNITFVQVDPSKFRTIVQQLTGASDYPSNPKLPVSHPARPAAASADIGPKKRLFKLHERRQAAMKKLEIKLKNNSNIGRNECPSDLFFVRQRELLVSPVSTLDFWSRGGSESARSVVDDDEEEKAIAKKGFYLHPSPLSMPGGGAEPELLPLFPLHSPRVEDYYDDNSPSK